LENLSDLSTFQVDRVSLSEQVAKQLQELIINGGLKPGDKVPPERQLAEQLSVSRTVIRESVKLLQERGLVKVVTGSGTYVSEMDPNVVVQSIGLFMSNRKNKLKDLFETRSLLEVEIASLAAERATKEDLENLEKTLDEMKKTLSKSYFDDDNLRAFVQADLEFHRGLAWSTNNSLLPILVDSIYGLLFEFSLKVSRIPGAPESAYKYHQLIYKHVSDHDYQKTSQEMRNHLLEAERFAAMIMSENEEEIDPTAVL
jgi:GntR family transcriptional regulator, transcriptional repressor for pyruvate dehydrogenase complex